MGVRVYIIIGGNLEGNRVRDRRYLVATLSRYRRYLVARQFTFPALLRGSFCPTIGISYRACFYCLNGDSDYISRSPKSGHAPNQISDGHFASIH